MSWVSAWRLAVGTLTVIPVRPPGGRGPARRGPGDAAGAARGAAARRSAAVRAGLAGRLTGWPPLLAGLVVVAVLALGTRALHLDGLADTVDGLGSGRDRERALEIMRRGDVGPMGVVALLLVLGGQAVAARALGSGVDGAALLAVVIAASRAALLVGCRAGVPAARPGGLGAAVAGRWRPLVLVGGGLLRARSSLVGRGAGWPSAWWIGLWRRCCSVPRSRTGWSGSPSAGSAASPATCWAPPSSWRCWPCCWRRRSS